MALIDSTTHRERQLQVVEIRFEDEQYFGTTEDGIEHPLIVDPAYQRPLDQRKVESIRADWDAVAMDPAVLSVRRNGDLAIVNGQHRIVAAILEGEGAVIAEVFTGLTVPREADIRLKKHNARPDTSLEKFSARLTREREKPGQATAIVALLEEFGTRINRSANRWSGINAVSTVERLYARDEGVILRRTLRAIKEAYGEVGGLNASSALMEGLAWFLHGHEGEYSWRKLVEQLRRFGPDGISDMSRGFKRAMGGSDWLNHYRGIVEAYNKAIRKPSNKLELKTARWAFEDSGYRFSERPRRKVAA